MNSLVLFIILLAGGFIVTMACMKAGDQAKEIQKKKRAKEEAEKMEREQLLAVLKQMRENPTIVSHNTQNNYETNNYLIQNLKKNEPWNISSFPL